MYYITELNNQNFKNFVKNGIVLVDIKAEWCGPCKVIGPIIDQLSIDFQGQLSVGKLDADSNRDILAELGIRNIPTILLYKNGEVVDRSVGSATKEKLTEMINQQITE
jgi:thioredoxin 1